MNPNLRTILRIIAIFIIVYPLYCFIQCLNLEASGVSKFDMVRETRRGLLYEYYRGMALSTPIGFIFGSILFYIV